MTDKIIIDRVDVSECKLYRDEISFVGGEIYTDVCSIWIWQRDYSGLEPNCVMKCHCEDNPNCYFKQLARKTQECEHWKHQAELGSDTTDRLAKQLEEKEDECEELKAKNYPKLRPSEADRKSGTGGRPCKAKTVAITESKTTQKQSTVVSILEEEIKALTEEQAK